MSAHEFFENLDRHELVTVRTVNGADCSCGWKAEPYSLHAWEEHVWQNVLPAQYEASVGWLLAEQRAEIADAEVARLREKCADYEAELKAALLSIQDSEALRVQVEVAEARLANRDAVLAAFDEQDAATVVERYRARGDAAVALLREFMAGGMGNASYHRWVDAIRAFLETLPEQPER